MMNLLQIGSGSGNLDKSIEDGFTNFVFKKKIHKKNVYIVEANSIHIKKLKKNWKNVDNIKIFNLAIVPDNTKIKKMYFYYSENDKPDYQIFSSSKNFVKKHFKTGLIKKKIVKCMQITNFLKKNFLTKIEFLSLDIEGMDFDVIMSIDFTFFNIKNISFEHIHLSFLQKCFLILKLTKYNYFFSGMGFDVRKSDWLFSKNQNNNRLLTFLLPFTPRRIWKKFSFSKLII